MVPSLGQNRARYSRLSDDMLHIIPEAMPDIREAAYLNVREHAGTWISHVLDRRHQRSRLSSRLCDRVDHVRRRFAVDLSRRNPGRQRTPRHTRHRASLHTSGPRHRRMGHRLPLLSAGRHAPARRGPVHGRAHPHRQQARNRFARLEFDERDGWRAAHQTGDGIDEQPGVVMNSGDMRGGEHVIGWQRCREDDKTVADMR